MGFLFKLAIVLVIAVMFVPVDPRDIAPGASGSPVITAAEAVTVAEAAWSDVGGFCARNPEACTSGGRFLITFGYKARAGAQMLAGLVDRHLPASLSNAGAANAPAVAVPVPVADPAVTGSIRPSARHPQRQWSRQTLSAADRHAPWQGVATRLD